MIVMLAAPSPEDVPRGMSFLLMRNRLNVAISRAKWTAYLLVLAAAHGLSVRHPGRSRGTE